MAKLASAFRAAPKKELVETLSMVADQYRDRRGMKPRWASCTRCKGTGIISWSSLIPDTKLPDLPCHSCRTTGKFFPPDSLMIEDAVTFKGHLRSSYRSNKDARCYYVWRMARFHGGKDVTMPVTASCVVSGDPFIRTLDLIADAIARRYLGTDVAAAYRWGNALGYLPDIPSGRSATA